MEELVKVAENLSFEKTDQIVLAEEKTPEYTKEGREQQAIEELRKEKESWEYGVPADRILAVGEEVPNYYEEGIIRTVENVEILG